MLIRAYLRASTVDQDANRAKQTLKDFVSNFNNQQRIATYYVENITGTKIERPELMRLIDEAAAGDILLIESMDRLTRLTAENWEELKRLLSDNKIMIVVVDLPSTHVHMSGSFDNRIMEIFNNMFLDLYAEFAYRDWERRRKVTRDGIEKAKRAGKYKGRVANEEKHQTLIRMFSEGKTVDQVSDATGYTTRHCFNLKAKYKQEIEEKVSSKQKAT